MYSNEKVFTLLIEHRPQWCALGLFSEEPESAVRYFCTPKDARIFASLGVDGIHYCTIPAFGDYVYVVNPMPVDDRYVLPVARNMAEFFSLVATLHGTQLIDQMCHWDRDTFLCDYESLLGTEEEDRARERKELLALFSCEEIKDPYGYVRALCDGFNPAAIPYTEEYYDTLGLMPVVNHTDDFISTVTVKIQ